jgi:hypothetical protein
MVAVIGVLVAEVVTVNVCLLDPAATVTEEGTDAWGSLEDSCIVAPPDGAAALNCTVPVAFAFPPTTDVGETLNAKVTP